MKLLVRLFGLALLLAVSAGCEVEAPYGGGYGVYGEYPYTYYGGYSPTYVYPYHYYHGPYDRDHYWDRGRYWERHRWHGDEHWGHDRD